MDKRDGSHCQACGVRYDDKHRKRQHHVLPIRFFGETGLIQWLCEDCHKKIELKIPPDEAKSYLWYFQLVVKFVQG